MKTKVAKAYLEARYLEQSQKFPRLRERVGVRRYVAANLTAAMKIERIK